MDGWYAYVTQPNGSVFTRQGGLNQIGSDLTLNAPMTGSGSHLPQITGFCSYHSQVNVGGTEVAYVVPAVVRGHRVRRARRAADSAEPDSS